MSTNASPPKFHSLPPIYPQSLPITATATPPHLQPPLPAFPPELQGLPPVDHKSDENGLMNGVHTPGAGKKNGGPGSADGRSKPHLCHICGRGFTTGGHLQRHQRIHTGVKAFQCPYPGCETRTSRQDNLQQHYRTHLSPTLRRGSGSAARAAVNRAMEAAGLKSSTSRAPRKSKNSNAGTPSSASAAGSASHLPSPYQTPTSQSSGPSSLAPGSLPGPGPPPYPQYMYDANGYPLYPVPPPTMGIPPHQVQSASSSRVPSPANGHSMHPQNMMPNPHQLPYYHPPPAFSPYGYPAPMAHPGYRHFPGQLPYGMPPHHAPLYSPGITSEHGGSMYSPVGNAFPPNHHSREGSGSYSGGVMTPGYPPPGPPPPHIANGYPSRTETSTPLSQSHGSVDDSRQDISGYTGGSSSGGNTSQGGINGNGPAVPGNGNGYGNHGTHSRQSTRMASPTPVSSSIRRKSPSGVQETLSLGLVDPHSLHHSTSRQTYQPPTSNHYPHSTHLHSQYQHHQAPPPPSHPNQNQHQQNNINHYSQYSSHNHSQQNSNSSNNTPTSVSSQGGHGNLNGIGKQLDYHNGSGPNGSLEFDGRNGSISSISGSNSGSGTEGSEEEGSDRKDGSFGAI